MQLRALTGLEREKLESDYKELLKQIAFYEDILSSPARVSQIIKQELRALNVLAAAGMVPALRYRPAPISKLAGAIVALCSRARAVIGETGATLAEALETAKCFH